MRRLLPLLLSVLFLPLAASAQLELDELVVWHPYQGPARSAFEKLVGTFEGKSGFRARAVAVPAADLPGRLAALAARGQGPDLFVHSQDRLGAWAEAGGRIDSVDRFLDTPARGRFLPATLEGLRYRGRTWGLPLSFRVVTMIYNRGLVPEAPLTSREMVAQARRLTSPELGKFGLATWYTDLYYHAPLMTAFGGGLFAPAGEPAVNTPANVQSLDLLKRWLRQGFQPAEPSTTLILSLFNEGKLAMVIAGPSFVERIAPNISYGLGPLPAMDEAGGRPMRPWITIDALYLAAGSQHKSAAMELARFLTDLPAARVLALEGRQTPAVAAVYREPEVAADPILAGFRRQLDTAVPMPNQPAMPRLWGPLNRALEAVVRRQASPQDALNQAQREAQR